MDDFLEANRVSRLQHEARLRELERGGRVIGSPMSPTPPPYPGEELSNGRVVGPRMSPLGPDADDDDDARSAAKKKKKKNKKRRKSLDSDAINEIPVNGDHDAAHPSPKKSKKSKKKKKSRNNEPNGAQSPDGQHPLVSHASGGSPPSGQQPVVNGVESHAPTLDTEAAEEESIPTNSVEDIESAHIKTEPRSNENGVPDHELPFRIAADSIVDGDDPLQKSPFIHKREMSIVDGELDAQSDDEAALPDLQPSQIKPEPPSSESESDLGSPSVARLGRLERSRSRSMSRPPPAKKPVDESVSLHLIPAGLILSTKMFSVAQHGRPSRIECTEPVINGLKPEHPSSSPRRQTCLESLYALIWPVRCPAERRRYGRGRSRLRQWKC